MIKSQGTSMRKVRVAHAIYSHAIGGSEMCALEICANLDPARYEPQMIFIHTGKGPLPGVLDKRGIPHSDLNRSRLTNLLWPILPAFALKRLNIDVLHVHHLGFLRAILPAARLAGIRAVVCTEHSKYEIEQSARLWHMLHRLPGKIEAFTVVSHELQRFFMQRTGLDASRIQVIRNGVDIGRFRPDGGDKALLNSSLPRRPGARSLIAVGRLTDAKDYPTLLAALAILRDGGCDVVTIIVGDGELHASLAAEVRRLKLQQHVILAGTRTDVEHLMPAADAYVLSSRHEGFPISLLEGMSCGRAAVATRVGGVDELLQDGVNGLIVEPENPAVLAVAIRRVMEDRELARVMGAAARETIEREFSWKTIARAYEAVYASLPGL